MPSFCRPNNIAGVNFVRWHLTRERGLGDMVFCSAVLPPRFGYSKVETKIVWGIFWREIH